MKISTSLELVRYIRHHVAGSEFQDVKAVEDFVDEQLATERDKREHWRRTYHAVADERDKLIKQLATEREAHDTDVSRFQFALNLALKERNELRSQLAAERVSWTELRDLLHLPSTDNDKSLVIHEIQRLSKRIHELEETVDRLKDPTE